MIPTRVSGGHWKLHIVSGKGLVVRDKSTFGKGTSDPFVRILSGGKVLIGQTKVVPKSLTPKWDEVFEWDAGGDEEPCVVLAIFDKDSNKDEPMGVVEIPADCLSDEGLVREWAVGKCVGANDASGSISVVASFIPHQEVQTKSSQSFIGESTLLIDFSRGGKMLLNVISGKGLVVRDKSLFSKGSSDPYVRILSTREFELAHTKVVSKSLDPSWNESFEWEMDGNDKPEITLALFDKNAQIDKSMGKVTVRLSDLVAVWPKDSEWPVEKCVGAEDASGSLRLSGNFIPNQGIDFAHIDFLGSYLINILH